MSSTNRSTRGGGEHDFFGTPAWATRAIVRALPDLPEGWWCEPSAGDGAIVRAVEEVRPGRQLWSLSEIRPEWLEATRDLRKPGTVGQHATGDFLDADFRAGLENPVVQIGNPPFSLAEEFARTCIARGGTTILLLRLAFLEGQKRVAFHREFPSDVYVLPKRPSFSRDGRTDSAAYGWFAWGEGRGNRWFTLEIEA